MAILDPPDNNLLVMDTKYQNEYYYKIEELFETSFLLFF